MAKAECEFCGATIRLDGFSQGDIAICFCGTEYFVADPDEPNIIAMGAKTNKARRAEK